MKNLKKILDSVMTEEWRGMIEVRLVWPHELDKTIGELREEPERLKVLLCYYRPFKSKQVSSEAARKWESEHPDHLFGIVYTVFDIRDTIACHLAVRRDIPTEHYLYPSPPKWFYHECEFTTDMLSGNVFYKPIIIKDEGERKGYISRATIVMGTRLIWTAGYLSIVGGSVTDDFMMSVNNAFLIAERVNPAIKWHTITIDFPAIVNSGPSGGLMFALVLHLLARGLKVPKNITCTGEIMPDGTVGDVGSVVLKCAAAEEYGIEHIFIPADNTEVFPKFKKINVVRVGTLNEVLAHLDVFACK